jgi:hypothetical protein
LFWELGSLVFIILVNSVKATLGGFQYCIVVLVIRDLIAALVPEDH